MASWHPGENTRATASASGTPSASSILLAVACIALYVWVIGHLAVTVLGAAA